MRPTTMPVMYTSPDEARSDLFLAGAVFVFGPVILTIVLRIFPLFRVPVVGVALVVLLPLVTTVLVPALLIRYRREPLRAFGLAGGPGGMGRGALLGLPLVAATIVLVLLLGGLMTSAFPVIGSRLVPLLSRVASWLGLAGLGIYMTVKARDAFRSDYTGVHDGLWLLGRIVMAVAGGATLLLVVRLVVEGRSGASVLALLVLPLGLAGALLLARRTLTGPTATSRATLITPTVIFALGPLALSFDAFSFVLGVYHAALYAGIGLLVGALLEARNDAWGPIGLALVTALLTQVGAVGF